MYDVAIVGARCAGSSLALGLARAGARVIMVDRTTFPSDTMSGHFIQPAGVSCLRRLGLLDGLAGLGFPALDRMSVDFGAAVLSGAPAPMPDGTAIAYAPRRYRFDPLLAAAAVAAGADLREATSFTGPVLEDGRVTGMTIDGPGGRETVRARLLVGADGKRSRVARAVGARAYDTRPAQTCAWYGYWDGAAVASTHLFVRPGLFAVTVPCGGDTAFLAVQWPRERFTEIRSDIDGRLRAAIASIPWLADRFAGARLVERLVGTGDLDSFFRTVAGPGWALVGDAGNHKDPITAQGMTDALLDAESLTAAVLDGLGGDGGEPDAALAAFGRARDARSAPMHRVTADLARLLPPPPEAQAGMAEMASDPAAVGRFLGVMAGSVHPDEIFGPSPAAAA